MITRHPAHTLLVATFVSIAAIGCGKSAGPGAGTGGVSNLGGAMATGGTATGGTATGGTATGGTATGGTEAGGTPSSGGQTNAGGTPGSGGRPGTGGQLGVPDASSAGGMVATGGTVRRDSGIPDGPGGSGGAQFGGTMGTGGATGGTSGTTVGTGGTMGTGGVATGGSSTGTSPVPIDCKAVLPANGVQHSGNTKGTIGNLAWSLWSNGTGATMTTFDTPGFRLTWGPDSGDVVGRIGLVFPDVGLTYDQYGPITAQFAESKSGTGGGYSYIGIYGFTTAPCVEFYIVDDSYSAMPFKPWSTTHKGTVSIDGSSYDLYAGTVESAGRSSCAGSIWHMFYSVRQTARTCGHISITQHFDAWNAAGMKLGNLEEVEVLVEAGGGTGSVDVPIANVTIGQ